MVISAPVRSDVFVGRAAELAFLHTRALDAIDGHAQFVVIQGATGIGKTRLLDEFFSRHERSLHTVRIRCSPAFCDPAALLNGLCDALAAVLQRQAPPRFERAGAIAYLRSAIRTASSCAFVLAIEDLHHAQSDTIRALEHLSGMERTLLIFTVADGETDTAPREEIADLRSRGAYELALAPLPPEAMRRMIRRFDCGTAARSRDFVGRVVRLSHGNPGLASELIRSAADGAGDGAMPVPPAMRHRARRMLDLLDAPARRLILIAATIGVTFHARDLAHVAQVRAPVVRELLQLAAFAGIVHETTPQQFAFTHPLVRAALRAEMTASFAASYHHRTALLFARRATSTDEFEAVAAQWRAAGNGDLALTWEERAADAAIEAHDFERAAAACRRAERDRPDHIMRQRLLLKAANALRRGGLEDEALLAFDDYLACGPADGETRANVLLEKMFLSWGAGDVDGSERLAHDILTLNIAPTNPVKARVRVHQAAMSWFAGRHEEALARLASVEREYPLADAQTLGQFHQLRALLAYSHGPFDAAIEEFQRGIRYIERSGNASLHVQQLCNFGNTALVHARNDLALDTLRRAFEFARVAGSESKRHLAVASYTFALMAVGRLSEAHDVLRSLEADDADVGELHAQYSVVVMLELGSMLGDAALVERAVDSDALTRAFTAREANRIVPLAAAFASHYWDIGEEDTARDLLHRALTTVDRVSSNYGFLMLVAKFGLMRDGPRARRMLERERVGGESVLIDAFLDLFDAFVAGRRGRHSLGATLGVRAAGAFNAIGWPFFEAQAYEAAGDYAKALRIYDRIGDLRDAKKVRASSCPPPRSGRHAVTLTPREREVARLAVDGLTTPQIAARLGIGQRTVEHHLQVVYGKFGIRSRWQIPPKL